MWVFLAATLGACALVVLWVLYMTAVSEGSDIVLRSAGALKIRKEDAPRLWNVVEEMCVASGLGAPPQIHIIESDAPNAFAVGAKPEAASVAITSGLASRLSRDERQCAPAWAAMSNGHHCVRLTRARVRSRRALPGVGARSDRRLLLSPTKYGAPPRARQHIPLTIFFSEHKIPRVAWKRFHATRQQEAEPRTTTCGAASAIQRTTKETQCIIPRQTKK